jgi:hypothetical protein
LEEAVALRGFEVSTLGLIGRAERRLAGCAAVARHLYERATGAVPL